MLSTHRSKAFGSLNHSLTVKKLEAYGFVTYEQAHFRVTRVSSEEESDRAARSLVKRHQESEPANSVIFSFVLRLREVKYHWSKNGKGEKTVNILSLMRSNLIDPHGVGNKPHVLTKKLSTFGVRGRVESAYYCPVYFWLNFKLAKEGAGNSS